MSWITKVISYLSGLGSITKETMSGLFDAVKKFFVSLSLIRIGETNEVLKEKEKETKDAKKAAKRKNNIDTLDDDDLDSGLHSGKS